MGFARSGLWAPACKMQQKRQLLSEQFSSPLLLAVACVAGSCSVCSSFLVEIQRRERSEARDVGGGKRLLQRIILSQARSQLFFMRDCVPTRRRAKMTALVSWRGGGVGRMRFSESTLRAF